MSRNDLQSYKVAKKTVKGDEKRALKLAIKKTGLSDRFLKTNHTDKEFVFEQIR
ncbi:hypothetical protein [Flavobacterium sp.]|uniref:hypothetical protein n=1 Tax=Flavobacterium sp. TaxID=239 RepID=UPI0025B8D588|nr:hypothetical protein [Flavobacterium sp.]|tara:strand:- start:739 stop:900 length:162 start_codon:yes stop_codon:yes gene_type:complete